VAELAAELPHVLPPDMAWGSAGGKVGFLHRHLRDADIYFIANTTALPISIPVHVRAERKHAEWWNADTGETSQARVGEIVTLEPYGSRLLVLSDEVPAGLRAEVKLVAGTKAPITLSDWTMSFPGSAGSAPRATEQHVKDTLWTDTAGARFYSGEVRYTTKFEPARLREGEHLVLRFAPGKAITDTQPESKPGMRAWFDPPIREAAIVVVNGKTVGDLWHPPYELDVTSAMRSGMNTLEVRVFNTAMNELAGQPPRDYTALKAKYGDRFQMQDMTNLQPVPSGIAGPVQLVYQSAVSTGGDR
jgi:hypothetical protein